MVAGRLLLPHSASAGPAATSTTPPVTAKPGLGFEERVSEFTLSNGMHFIILERHEAPVLSCIVHANVGAFDEAPGSTGGECRRQILGAGAFIRLHWMVADVAHLSSLTPACCGAGLQAWLTC